MHIGIAGAGLLGRLLALQLGRSGHRVDVFDPATDAQTRGAAGWTAAGMLSPVAELECADEGVFALGVRSVALWPRILSGLPDAVDFHQRGSLLLAHRGDDGAARRTVELLRRKAPPDRVPKALAPAELRALEPAVQGAAHAWLLEHEAQIDCVQAMLALVAGTAQLPVRWHWQTRVDGVTPGKLTLADGATPHFDHAFDVRGTGARPDLSVRGVRGEIITLHAPGVMLQRPLRLLHPRHRVYIVPRAGDRIMVGASEIESEDRSPVSLRSTVELLAAAHSVLPELAEARIVLADVNLRPALPDNLPITEQTDGLTRINGLFRHGWLIAPALIEDALAGLNSGISAAQKA